MVPGIMHPTSTYSSKHRLQSLIQSRERLAELHSTAGRGIDEACKELDRGAELLTVLWKDLEHTWRTLRFVSMRC